MSDWFRNLADATAAELETHMRSGQPPDLERLAGFEYRGVNTGGLARRLGLQKFIKGFFRDAAGFEGYNIAVVQDGLDAPWLPKPSPEDAKPFGFFIVTLAPESRYSDAALLDYGASPRNPRLRIERGLRDYLVVPDPQRSDVLLGKAYLALGPARVPVGYFVIERLREADWRP